MRRNTQRVLALLVAVGLVVTAVGGAVQTGMVERERVDPVGESQALACGGLCIAGVAGATAIAAGGAGAAIGMYLSDSDVNETALAEADAQETHLTIYESSATQYQNQKVLTDSYENYLQDTPEIARMEAKNAYIRALENGSSEATARSKAISAAAEYYATKQDQLINSWEVASEKYRTDRNLVQNTANLSGIHNLKAPDGDAYSATLSNTTVTLVNGTDRQVTQYSFSYSSDAGNYDFSRDITNGGTTVTGIEITAPNSNYDPTMMMNWSEYSTAWSKIETQNNNV